MIKIKTFEALLYILDGSVTPVTRNNNGTDWLRQAVNIIYNRHKSEVKSSGIDTSVFHDHDENTGLPIIRYPRILYIRSEGHFHVTGLNEGADAIEKLFDDRKQPLYINSSCFVQFRESGSMQFEVKTTNELAHYSLTNWLALSSVNYYKYKQTDSLTAKIAFLEQMLHNHITKDFGKDFDYNLADVKPTITGIDGFDNACMPLTVNRHTHDFKPFTITFSSNIHLPPGISLGNGKAYGFGYLQRIP